MMELLQWIGMAFILVLQAILLFSDYKTIKVDDPYFIDLEKRFEKLEAFISDNQSLPEFMERANMHMAGLMVMSETPEAQPGI